ncbi:AP-3 complex subunit sigma-1 isoform X1 [Odocoileus virginianus]|uniref:AP-3 complex subunit sigma-1 isoform X1 n=1 Tax=Odocoileus virginianus TaxID=9874 RepID=A0ABM4HS78_ODOVR
MIKAILIFNNHGKPRLSKFYQPYSEDTQQQIIRETFHLVSKRDENVCNFLEGGLLIGGSDNKLIYRHYATLYFVFCVDSSESELGILDLIQRWFFHSLEHVGNSVVTVFPLWLSQIFEEEGVLSMHKVFVETLDKCFENVCELDLIFHVDKVHNILAEMVMGGMVLETNMNEIVTQIDAQNKLEKSELIVYTGLFCISQDFSQAGLAGAPARAVSAVKNMNLPEIPRNINIGDISIKVPNLPSFK